VAPSDLARHLMKRPLSPTQLRILHNIANKMHIMTGVAGQSAHGAFPQTLTSVCKRELVLRVSVPDPPKGWRIEHVLTESGVTAHRENCCSRGMTIEDAKIRLLEVAMKKGEDDDEPSFHGDHVE